MKNLSPLFWCEHLSLDSLESCVGFRMSDAHSFVCWRPVGGVPKLSVKSRTAEALLGPARARQRAGGNRQRA
jgi:hypothetical protein